MKTKQISNTPSTAQLRSEFWLAGDQELLNRATIAAGIGRSIGWLELKAVTGDGIPYLKCGRRCLYRKADALAWLAQNSKRVKSTSEYDSKIGAVS